MTEEKNQTARIELPGLDEATATAPILPHISVQLINAGLEQVKKNMADIDEQIKKVTEQLQQLQFSKVASMAQNNLLNELRTKILASEK